MIKRSEIKQAQKRTAAFFTQVGIIMSPAEIAQIEVAGFGLNHLFLATPLFIHARQSIEALRAGKHVLSEVIAATTLEESWELIETVEATGKQYMMAENYCFLRSNMMVMNMVRANTFGPLTHLEGAYVHDCRNLLHDNLGNFTWRARLQSDYNGMNYPTHSLGPLALWLDLNRYGGDRLESLSTFVSRSVSAQRYFLDHFGSSHPGAQPGYWKQGDSTVSVLRTANGVLITLRLDWTSCRPHHMTHYALQGENGAFVSARSEEDEPLVWLQSRSPGTSWSWDHPARWESLWNLTDSYEHEWWKEYGKQAEQAGHGGGDFFVIKEFAASIHEGRKPVIDVYDAVLWSSIFPLSMQSSAKRGAEVTIPDFRYKKR